MSETLVHQSHADTEPNTVASLTPEELAAAKERFETFLGDNASHLGAMFGLRHLSVEVGDHWATNLKTGEVTASLHDYLTRGYSPEMAAHDICHEVAAHLREVEFDPALTREVKAFLDEPTHPQLRKATGIFHNIFSDIAGNNLVYAALPQMREVAGELYSQLLFKEDDLQAIPRHLQFLYKTMRTEMIPGSDTAVLPEVDAMIAEFRDYRGMGDLIAYSTQVAKSRTQAMPNREKFDIWTKVIYPRWLELFTADQQDPQFQQQPQSGDSGADGEPSEQQAGEPSASQPQPGQPDFSPYHDDYSENKHPEPIDHDELDKLKEAVAQQQSQEARDKRRQEREAADSANPEKQLDAKIRRETGHSLAEKRRYDGEIIAWSDQITQLRDVFRSIINERIAYTRRLRGNHTEGALLNPDTLVQAFIDVQTHHPEPPAYADYEKHEAERRLTGKTDYVLVFDRSGSMSGERAKAAASSLVICLEALALMERDIKAAEAEHNIDVDLDIRTAVYTFNDEIHCTKPLSPGLSDKERYDSYGLVSQPGGNNADSHALAEIEKIPIEPDRKQILIVISDGKADDKIASRASVERLRKDGWHVYGVSIGSEDAVQLYAPDSERIDDPAGLPAMLQRLIERTLR